MPTNYRKVFAIKDKNIQKMLEINPKLNNKPGIYFLTRTDEEGIKHCYVGLAKKVLTRLAQHLSTYQYIDNSIRKHGFYSFENIHGYKVNFVNCKESELEEKERYYITLYAKSGYQMKNRDTGGGKGKIELGERKPTRTYSEGKLEGKKQLAAQLIDIIDKHLNVSVKADKKNNKISQKALVKFYHLINPDTYTRGEK